MTKKGHIHKQIFKFFSAVLSFLAVFVETMSTNFKRNRQFSLREEIVFHSIMLEVDYFHIYLFEQNN